jgi:hypothetical protein
MKYDVDSTIMSFIEEIDTKGVGYFVMSLMSAVKGSHTKNG